MEALSTDSAYWVVLYKLWVHLHTRCSNWKRLKKMCEYQNEEIIIFALVLVEGMSKPNAGRQVDDNRSFHKSRWRHWKKFHLQSIFSQSENLRKSGCTFPSGTSSDRVQLKPLYTPRFSKSPYATSKRLTNQLMDSVICFSSRIHATVWIGCIPFLASTLLCLCLLRALRHRGLHNTSC